MIGFTLAQSGSPFSMVVALKLLGSPLYGTHFGATPLPLAAELALTPDDMILTTTDYTKNA